MRYLDERGLSVEVDPMTMDVDDHIAWIRQYASDARIMARTVLGWRLDILGTYAGTTEVIPWTEDGLDPDPTARVIHANGFAYLIRDV